MHNKNQTTETSTQQTAKLEQSDPQMTELKGFVNQAVDLEPTLTDRSNSHTDETDENRFNSSGENP